MFFECLAGKLQPDGNKKKKKKAVAKTSRTVKPKWEQGYVRACCHEVRPFLSRFFPKASLRCLGSRLGVFREERGLSGR